MLQNDFSPDISGLIPVREGRHCLVFRGTASSDGRSVIVKVLKNERPSPEELAGFKNEFELTHDTRLAGVVHSRELKRVGRSLVIIQEDFGGVSLDVLAGALPFPWEEALAVAIGITAALVEIHGAGIIHKNLTPAHVLIAPDNRAVKLTGLSAASVLRREHPDIISPESLGLDLRYISPELTGRMNRAVDHRCDLYSLGAILYELLTGRPPFVTEDPLELVYSHLARRPDPVNGRNPDVPPQLSALVAKLLAKNPEERYRSARGVLADLERCAAVDARGDIPPFGLGAHDGAETFALRQKLYGREAECDTLMASFARAAAGSRELMLVAGYSGIGKTSLVREVYKPVTRRRGYFSQGKFDQFQRAVPFSALVAALNALIHQILTEPEERLAQWRQRLTQALGSNGRLLTDVIPDLELIVGPQPPVLPLPEGEAQNRFNGLFQSFIRAFCDEMHPLILFLDDLQWADSASLKMLEQILLDEETHHILVLGAYRDNEVSPAHPLALALDDLRRQGAAMGEIVLAPLRAEHVAELIADSLALEHEEALELAHLVVRKTAGNPFFVIQFLRTLHEDNLLRYSADSGRWDWDLARIEARDITDNVVDLLIGKLRRLPDRTQQALRLAACIGNTFDLHALGVVLKSPPADTFQDLLPALREEFILNTSGIEVSSEEILTAKVVIVHFRFLHDRVQQAAYALIDQEERREVHLLIGRLLLADAEEQGGDERVFAIADHLNAGRSLITDPLELVELAAINLRAARRAREATAYEAALDYLLAATERLPDITWQTTYPLALDLHRERGAMEHLTGRFADSERTIRQAAIRSTSALDRAETLHMLITQYTLAARYPEAIATAREALALVGVSLPDDDFEAVRDRELAAVLGKLANRPVASLADLPPMTDPAKKIAMKLLVSLGPPCYRAHQRLWGVIVAMEMNLCLDWGDVPAATYTYPAFGGLLGFVRNDYRSCAELARLTLALADKYQSPADRSVAHLMVGASLDHWFRHLSHAEEDYRRSYQVGVDSGNLQYSVYAFGHTIYCRFFRGMNLAEQLNDLQGYLAFSRQRKNQWGIDLMEGVGMVLANLTGMTDDPAAFSHGTILEAEFLARCEENHNVQVLCIYQIVKMTALIIHGMTTEALAASREAESRLISVATQGLLPAAEFRYLRGLLMAMLLDTPSPPAGAADALREARDHLAVWAANAPENFRHKHLLLEAELAACEGRFFEAVELYGTAAAAASQHGFVQHEALAHERAARFWLRHGKDDYAFSHLGKARVSYGEWGARRKVEQFQHDFPLLDSDSETASESGAGMHLDLHAVMKASRAISQQIRHDDLVGCLLEVVLESAGAQKGYLVLPFGRGYRVEARASSGENGAPWVPVELSACREVSAGIIAYVARTREPVILDEATESGMFAHDEHVATCRPQSVLSLPLLKKGELAGILYLENNLAKGAFTADRVEIVRHLAAQAAISLESARFYSRMEELVAERTRALAEANREIQVTLADLERSNRDLEQFAYVASHDLQEPLRMVTSYIQLLQQRYQGSLDADADEFIGFAVDGAERMKTLIRDLLSYSRIGSRATEFAPVNTTHVVIQAREFLRIAIAESGAEVTCEGLPQVEGDETQLLQLFQNLIGNAIKFRGSEPPRVHVAAELQGSEWLFSVRDNGIGIDPRFADRIFIIFQRLHTREVYPGTGIGLAICKRIVERHGGRIWNESEQGRGATFFFTLPDRAKGLL